MKTKVKAYRLMELDELIKYEQFIPKLLFDLPQNSDQYFFEIAPISGWLYYANDAELFKNETPQFLPKNEYKVEKIAKGFLKNVEKSLQLERNRNPKFGLRNLFPTSNIEPVIQPIYYDFEGIDRLDHWLVRFVPTLSANQKGGKHAQVVGASLSIRIGNGGKIIEVSSNWRPITGIHYVSLIDSKESEDESNIHSHTIDSSENHHKDSETIRKLCYWLKGENFYQNFLLPLYVRKEGHHLSYSPASKNSLVVSIIEDHYALGADLYASIKGGSGRYRLEWASWEIAESDTTYQDLGTFDRIHLGLGSYCVNLTVIDEVSLVVEQIQNLVFVIDRGSETNSIS